MPGTRSSRPRGKALAGDFGRGREMLPIAWREWAITRPAYPLAAATAATPAAPRSTERRLRSAPTGAPGTTGSPRSARVRPASTASPTRPVTMPGTASLGCTIGRLSTAYSAIATSTASSAAPRRNDRRARSPATPASTSTPTSTDPTRIVLSWVPKWAIAQFLTGVGVWSITSSPTASTGDVAGSVSAATRWPTPVPARAARTPYRAKRSLEVTRGGSSREWIGMGGWAPQTVADRADEPDESDAEWKDARHAG